MLRKTGYKPLGRKCGQADGKDSAIVGHCDSCGKRQRLVGQRDMRTRIVEGDFDNVAATELLAGDQLRGVKTSIRTEGTAIDRPEPGCPFECLAKNGDTTAGWKLVGFDAIDFCGRTKSQA